MAKFCTECGKEIKEGVAFCTECGAKAPADPAPSVTETVTEAKDTKVEIPVVHTPPAQSYQAQQPYTQPAPDPATATTETVTEAVTTKVETSVVHTPPVQSYQAQQTYTQPAPDPTSKVVGTGAYFGLMLLFALPIIGFIACIIMAFAPKNKNIKHFARAQLIWTVIAIVLIGILVAVITLLTNSLMDYINQLTDGQFSDFGDLFGQLGDPEGVMDQYQNGGLEGLPIE